MKTILFAASLLALTASAMAADVGVSINIGQPGFYGQIDIGDFPQPRVVYAQPVVVHRPAVYVEQQPVYMRVPPGHSRNWKKHCGRYNACGQRVMFVQDSWYNKEYAPRYRAKHGDRGHDRHEGRGNDRHDRGDDNDRGRGNGKGHGNGHGKGRD